MASAWFQAEDYFYNKLAQMQKTTDPAYTAERLATAFDDAGYTIAGTTDADIASAANQLERHFNEYGNAENVSPNNYFDVDFYKADKLAQLAQLAPPQTPPAGYSSWNEQALDVAMKDAGLSYWDHYMLYGMAEGINPSEQFNTDEYLTAKMDQLNALQPPQALPDGSFGTWTREDVIEAFQEADVNPIEHYFDYGMYEEGLDFTPGEEPGPDVPGVDVEIKAGQYTYTDDGKAVNFAATINTIDPRDNITGSGDDDQLTVKMNGGQFGGFVSGSMQGVPVVNLVSGSEAGFRATNVTGVTTYNLDGSISLRDINEEVSTINLKNADEAVTFGLTSKAAKGDNTINLGLENVVGEEEQTDGTIKDVAVNVIMQGVEIVNINSTGTAKNMVDMSMDTAITNMTVKGDAALQVATNAKLNEINAAESKGGVEVKAGNGGSLSTFTGGEGEDTLELGSGASGTVKAGLTGVETLRLNNTGNITVNGSNMEGLETIALKNQSGNVTLQNLGDTLSMSADGTNTATVKAPKLDALTLDVKEGAQFNGSLNLADATALTINLAGADDDGNFSGVNLNGGQQNLQHLSSLFVSGEGDVDLSTVRTIGAKSANLFVDTTAQDGNFQGVFDGSSTAQNLFFYGGNDGANGITVGRGYSFVQINSGSANDTIDMRGWTAADIAAATLEINAGSGSDRVLVQDKAAQTALTKAVTSLTTENVVTEDEYLGEITGGSIDINGESIVVPTLSGKSFDYTAKGNVDASGVTFADPDQVVNWDMGNGASLSVGQLTGTPSDPKTTVDVKAANVEGGSASFTYTGSENGAITLNTGAVADAPVDPDNANAKVTLANTGSGDLTINPENVTHSSGLNVGFAGITDLTLSSSSADGSITIPAGTTTSGAATTTPSNVMVNVDTMTLDGAGDITIGATVGNSSHDLTVDAGQMTGKLTIASMLGGVVKFTGGDGGTDVQSQLYSGSSSAASTYTFGSGQDEFTLYTRVGNSTTAQATINLGSDGEQDIVNIFSPASMNNAKSVVTINGFDLGIDKLVNLGAASIAYTKADNGSSFIGAVKAMDGSLTSVELTANSTSNLAYSGNAEDGYTIYAILGCKNDFTALGDIDSSTAANGMVLVKITGVESVSQSITVGDLGGFVA